MHQSIAVRDSSVAITSSARVLIVEDHADSRDLLELFLTQNGLEVTVASCARDALEALVAAFYDVLILDLLLPDASGWDVMEHINSRNLPSHIIVCTAAVMNHEQQRAMSGGCTAFFPKPIDLDALLECVASVGRR